MIRNIRHKGLLRFFADSDSRGINAKHAAKIERLLDRLDAATKPEDMKKRFVKLFRIKSRMW